MNFAEKIVTRAIGDLVPYAKNPRTHSQAQIAKLAASIKQFGFTNPILTDDAGNIIAGHGRYEAAMELGYAEVPTIPLGWLNEVERRAYIIADNRLALDAGWDTEILKEEFVSLREEGFDLGLTGFGEDELDGYLVETEFLPGDEGDQQRLDEKKKVSCPNCSYEFTPT